MSVYNALKTISLYIQQACGPVIALLGEWASYACLKQHHCEHP